MNRFPTDPRINAASFSNKEKGASMVEYSIMLSLIAIISILVVRGVGDEVSTLFSRSSTSLATASG
jgi:Flp pilus assembly pilin Flp